MQKSLNYVTERGINPFKSLGKQNRLVLLAIYKKVGTKPFTLREVNGIVSSSQNLRMLKDFGKLRKYGYCSGSNSSVLWRIPDDIGYGLERYIQEVELKPQ